MYEISFSYERMSTKTRFEKEAKGNSESKLWRQRGRLVSVSDLQFSGPGFKSHSDHHLKLFHGSPEFKPRSALVNSQLVCFRSVGILNNVMFNFELFVSVVCYKHFRG